MEAQNYEISCYTKIGANDGNFTADLDVQDQLGISAEAIGDLDGDGVTDIAVGAFTDDDGGPNTGAIYIIFLNEDDTVKSFQKISATEGGFNGLLDDDDVFGASISYLGDMNGDGDIELAVGAEYDGDGGFWHGAVWILSLNSSGMVTAYTKISDTQGGFTGGFNGDVVFGTDVELLGDLDGDGNTDIAVGSRRDYDGGDTRGALWILFLNSDFSVKSYQKISSLSGNFTETLNDGDYFGGSVANLGDMDGDGVIDLAVGSYRDNDGGVEYGAFYVLFMNSNGTVKSSQKVSANSGGFSYPLNFNALFGRSIDTLSDTDNDGLIEILVGCMGCTNPTTGLQTGAFFLMELNNDGTVSEYYHYTQGVNGFDGILNDAIHFGGSVAYISGSEPLKVVTGAYRDVEGAIWILNFGPPPGSRYYQSPSGHMC